jgi:hypothetical protein
MYVVETMMGRCHRHDLCRPTHPLERKSLLEIPHEVCDAGARRRNMPTNSDVMFRICAPFTWNHPKRALLSLDEEHGFRRIAIELAMQPA